MMERWVATGMGPAIVTAVIIAAAFVVPVDAAPAFTSPRSMCEYYRARWEQGLMKVVSKASEESTLCLVQVGDPNSGIGYIKGYYEGGKFCMSSYGAYFNNAGIADSTSCVSVSGGGGTQTTGDTLSVEGWKKLLQDVLHDPNLKWYTLAALIIAGGSLLSGRIIRMRERRK